MIDRYQILINIAGIVVTVISIIVSIWVTTIATKADNEIKESTQRIEILTNRMDSAITRIEPIVQNTFVIANNLVDKTIIKEYPANTSLVKQYWEKANELINAEDYIKAIEQYKKVANYSMDSRKDAYFNIAVAYANLYHLEIMQTKNRNHIGN